MKKAFVLAISIYIMLFASVKAAADHEFAWFDKDSNGSISLLEAKLNHTLYEQFTNLDLDSSGDLSASEFAYFTG
ncbi:hypothetical protein [Pseudoalteromonas piratica]|uniref:Calmodulin n=1 Tax=Pseudoalteromonas piratica TaxID=1348114 RepID=A0A0A7ELM1_9GAMM|nr:hypothetical protein [Pseudoalteromonas piratica]AIY66867.1 calmodulin [Pseudoalteromonas piratica]